MGDKDLRCGRIMRYAVGAALGSHGGNRTFAAPPPSVNGNNGQGAVARCTQRENSRFSIKRPLLNFLPPK